jgi:hypothetical protein
MAKRQKKSDASGKQKKVSIKNSKKKSNSKIDEKSIDDSGSPLQKQKKVVKRAAKRVVKRAAKRVVKRKPSAYNILQKEIAKYCVDNYGRKCSKSEISQIYQSLKTRFFDVDEKKLKVSPSDIAKTIDEKLAYRGRTKMPVFLQDFYWFDVIVRLWSNDGGFFSDEDILVFDISSVGLGKRQTPFFSLVEIYQDEIYTELTEFFEEVENQTGKKLNQSPIPRWIYDEEQSDEANRKFVWKIAFDDEEQPTGQETDELDINQKDIDNALKKAKSVTEDEGLSKKDIELNIEKEKTSQEKEKTKQQAMSLLEKGLISYEDFQKLIS